MGHHDDIRRQGNLVAKAVPLDCDMVQVVCYGFDQKTVEVVEVRPRVLVRNNRTASAVLIHILEDFVTVDIWAFKEDESTLIVKSGGVVWMNDRPRKIACSKK